MCWYYNRTWHYKIQSDNNLYNKVTWLLLKINTLNLDEIILFYKTVFSNYESDPGNGLIDWSPSLVTMLAKRKDDCDGSAVLWLHLGKKYCELNNLKINYIKTFAFLHPGKIRKSHVMCIALVEDNYIIFDYSNIIICDFFSDIIHYYIKKYLKDNSNIEDIVFEEIPEVKSIKL